MCKFFDHICWKAIQSIVYLMISITVLLYGNNILRDHLNNQRVALDLQSKTLADILVVQTQVNSMIKHQQNLVAQELSRAAENIKLQLTNKNVIKDMNKLLNDPVNTAKEKK